MNSELQETLTKHFGADFYARYQNLEKEVGSALKVLLLMDSREKVQNHHVKPMWQHFLAVAAMEKATKVKRFLQHPKSGRKINSSSFTEWRRDAATCKKLEHLVNRCNYARQGAMFASNLFNTVTHVLNGLISVMCGCLFVGPVHLCVLKNFPVNFQTASPKH
ncbi:hypothetical protein Esti_003216 [Eimeria stiedai]